MHSLKHLPVVIRGNCSSQPRLGLCARTLHIAAKSLSSAQRYSITTLTVMINSTDLTGLNFIFKAPPKIEHMYNIFCSWVTYAETSIKSA